MINPMLSTSRKPKKSHYYPELIVAKNARNLTEEMTTQVVDFEKKPRAKLKSKRRKMKRESDIGKRYSNCRLQVTKIATATTTIVLTILLLSLNSLVDTSQYNNNHHHHYDQNSLQAIQGQTKRPTSMVQVEVKPTAIGQTPSRNDDISMINERLPLVQDITGTTTPTPTIIEAEAAGLAGKKGKDKATESNWPPVDVDGNEINQYKDEDEDNDEKRHEIQAKVAPKIVGQEGEEVEKKIRNRNTGEERKKTQSVDSKRRRSKRAATIATTQSDGSPEIVQTNTSNKTTITTTVTTTTKTNYDERKEQNTGQEQQDNLKCRLEKDWYMEFEQYKHYACANCYSLLPPLLFTKKLIFKKELKGLLFDEDSNRLVMSNETDLIKGTFQTERNFNFWQQCCEHAIDCCRRNSVYLPKTKNSTGHLIDDTDRRDVCPATWDGFSCWPDSPAGLEAKHDCPMHVYFLEFMPICAGQVTKQCFSNGSWYVKNGHEWSNFSKCNGIDVYTHRMLIGGGLHLFSVIVIGPALLILGKMRQRFGTRRVRILRWLLFWLLLNGLFSATQKIGIILKIFDKPVETPARNQSAAAFAISQRQTYENRTTLSMSNIRAVRELSLKDKNPWIDEKGQVMMDIVTDSAKIDLRLSERISNPSNINSDSDSKSKANYNNNYKPNDDEWIYIASVKQQLNSIDQASGNNQYRRRRMLFDQSASSSSRSAQANNSSGHNNDSADQHSFLIVLFCWTLSVGIKITRLFGYAWMFTSAVYLCSVLHFSPAEPPPLFMSWLMFSTHTFPVVIGTIYVAVRSIYEPSPLTLLFKLPYHYVQGDMDYVNYLKDTQLDCWMVTSKVDQVEDIADLPYLVLVLLNTALFVITLIIMCRFKKLPGSTRPETSLWGYFKAAGMLVFLYGAHYLLLAYTPKVEGCMSNQVWHYAMLFVDGIQGVAISLVFCYRTSAGKEVICKWWNNMRDEHNCYCSLEICHRRRRKTSRHQSGLLKQNSRSNRSTRSSNSNCNGKDMVTELSNVHANNF